MRRLGSFVLGTIVVAAACSSPSASPSHGPVTTPGSALPTLGPPPVDVSGVPSTVTIEAAAGSAAWIGPAGGVLTATAASGVSYELGIPAGAVARPTAISMVPVTAIDGLPLSGGFAGGVFLRPAGLQLAEPATLRILVDGTAASGSRLVGLDLADGGVTPALIPAFADGTSAIFMSVAHFSTKGAAFGTSQDLQFASTAPTTDLAGYLTRILALPVPWDSGAKATAKGLIEDAWFRVVQPVLGKVGTDLELLRRIADWRQFVFMLNLFVRNGDVIAAIDDGIAYQQGSGPDTFTVAYLGGQGLLDQRISEAIAGNKELCNAAHDLEALANMWFWAGVGARYAPDLRSWEAEAKGCAEVAVSAADLPTTLTNGGTDTIRLQFAMAFTDGTNVPIDAKATLNATGFEFAPSGGTSFSGAAAAGQALSAGVTATKDPPYSVAVNACWVLSGFDRNVCGSFSLPFAQPEQTPGPTTDPGAPDPAPDIAGTYSVTLVCGNVIFGKGEAQVTRSGNSVSVQWSVSTSNPGDGSGGLCGDALRNGTFPTSGGYTGTLFVQPAGNIDILLSDWSASPCLVANPAPTSAAYDPRRHAIGIPVGRCPPSALFGSMGYSTTKTGP